MFGACCVRGRRCVGGGFAERRELGAPGDPFGGGPPGEGVPGGNEISGVDRWGAEAGDGVPGSLECRGRGAAALIEVEPVPVDGPARGAGAAATGVGGSNCLLKPATAFRGGIEDVASLRCGVSRPGEVAAGSVRTDRGTKRVEQCRQVGSAGGGSGQIT